MLLVHIWSSAFQLVLCIQINNSVCQAISGEVLKVAFQMLYALFNKRTERGTDIIITCLSSFLYRCQAQHSAQLLEGEVGFYGHNAQRSGCRHVQEGDTSPDFQLLVLRDDSTQKQLST